MGVTMMGNSAVRTKKLRRKGGGSARGGARSTARLEGEVRALRRLIHEPEEKNLDVDQSVTPSTTGVLTLTSGISQGTDIGNRVGDSIKVTRISWMGRAALSPVVTTFSTLRLLLFRDMEIQGAVPALADILETGTGTVSVRSPINFINRKRFSVLWDQIIVLDPNTHYSEVLRGELVVNKTVRYRGTGNTVAAAAEGTIYWLLVSDEATNAPTVAIYTQLQFVDS